MAIQPNGHTTTLLQVQKCNDAYSTYLSIGKPTQLSRRQVEQIKKQNDGSPISKEIVTIKDGITFTKELDIRENHVVLFKPGEPLSSLIRC